MNDTPTIDAAHLLARLNELGQIGRTPDGKLSRIALTDEDKAGRDAVCSWMSELGMTVDVDEIGNIFGTWDPVNSGEAPIMIGSHIDTVMNAGHLDGSYGVLAGLAVVRALQAAGLQPARPMTVAAFTNEEGVRYAPDMMGSLVHAGGLDAQDALATIGTDRSRLGQELARIGYNGDMPAGTIRPHTFLELHIEQGPILEAEGLSIGVVENLQGISWQQISIRGQANHAGTTPMHLRRDAGRAATSIADFVHGLTTGEDNKTVATIGSIEFKPNLVNVIPSSATMTIDLRNPDEECLANAENALKAYISELAVERGVEIETKQLVRTEPVTFDNKIVGLIEEVCASRNVSARRMTSGAGHDAQMMARIAPTAMIFVPSEKGISHNPQESTKDEDLVLGADILLNVVQRLLADGP